MAIRSVQTGFCGTPDNMQISHSLTVVHTVFVILTSSVQYSCSFLPHERLRNDGKLVFRDKKALDNKSLISLLSVVPLYTLLVICILTRTSGSRRYCKTRKNVQQYCTLKRLIRYVYIYLSAHIIYSEK